MNKCCGTCGLYARNFYNRESTGWIMAKDEQKCCADAFMDLPQSWDIGRIIPPEFGAHCPIHQPLAAQPEQDEPAAGA